MDTNLTKEDSFKDLFESTFTSYAKGKLLKGKVLTVNSLGIVVNIGGKKMALLKTAKLKQKNLLALKLAMKFMH